MNPFTSTIFPSRPRCGFFVLRCTDKRQVFASDHFPCLCTDEWRQDSHKNISLLEYGAKGINGITGQVIISISRDIGKTSWSVCKERSLIGPRVCPLGWLHIRHTPCLSVGSSLLISLHTLIPHQCLLMNKYPLQASDFCGVLPLCSSLGFC